MKYKIFHETLYTFNQEVFLEPHFLRFRPKDTPYNKLISFNIEITPNPAGISDQFDVENNRIHFCWFDNSHKSLKIETESIVETTVYNPLNFILYPVEFAVLPAIYPEVSREAFHSSLLEHKAGNNLKEYGRACLADNDSDTIRFLTHLTKQIHKDFEVIYREEGNSWEAEKTFKQKKGSCRDLAWMQVQILRSAGLATRFVSGYYYLQAEAQEFELHAWVEVFLPGAGWVGLDPSQGILVGNTHIPVASSVNFENTLPVIGSTRGMASSELKTNLLIELID